LLLRDIAVVCGDLLDDDRESGASEGRCVGSTVRTPLRAAKQRWPSMSRTAEGWPVSEVPEEPRPSAVPRDLQSLRTVVGVGEAIESLFRAEPEVSGVVLQNGGDGAGNDVGSDGGDAVVAEEREAAAVGADPNIARAVFKHGVDEVAAEALCGGPCGSAVV